MATFSDIFKKSFLEGFRASNITTGTILVTLFVTAILALYIFCVYYLATKKTFYSKTFNISLALISVITASIILAMQSNLVISLGMVGALSIVRFRTAIKDPMDLMFLFWAISVGIITGAQMFKIAILASLILTIGLFLLELTPQGKANVLLLVNAKDLAAEKEIIQVLGEYAKYSKIKSRNLTKDGVDLIIDLKTKQELELLTKIKAIAAVTGASLMAHDGEVSL